MDRIFICFVWEWVCGAGITAACKGAFVFHSIFNFAIIINENCKVQVIETSNETIDCFEIMISSCLVWYLISLKYSNKNFREGEDNLDSCLSE